MNTLFPSITLRRKNSFWKWMDRFDENDSIPFLSSKGKYEQVGYKLDSKDYWEENLESGATIYHRTKNKKTKVLRLPFKEVIKDTSFHLKVESVGGLELRWYKIIEKNESVNI